MRELIRNQLPAIIALVIATGTYMTWQLSTFSTKAESEPLHAHLERYELDKVNREILKNEFWTARSTRLDQDDPEVQVRIRQLAADRRDLDLKKKCIIDHNPLCD